MHVRYIFNIYSYICILIWRKYEIYGKKGFSVLGVAPFVLLEEDISQKARHGRKVTKIHSYMTNCFRRIALIEVG